MNKMMCCILICFLFACPVWSNEVNEVYRIDWSRQPGTGESDVANDVASDGAGGVFLAGSTRGVLGESPLEEI